MKLKLAQRIAISYYKTKIKTIGLLSKRKAAEKAFQLFCKPYSGKPKRKEPPVFHHAKKLSFQFEKLTIRGWQWAPEKSNGKKILIVHGFDSCSYKFDKYIQPLTHEGFTVLAFDAPAHGISDGKFANAFMLKNCMLEIEKIFGPLYGIMAHSMGGIAAALFAEEIKTLQKLILIAPATETQRAIDNFFKFVPIRDTIKNELTEYIIELAQQPLSYFSVARSVQTLTTPTLWIHDEDDWICPIEDILPIKNLDPTHVKFHITKGLGHNKIYRDNKVSKKIIDFFVI
jgi:pimeloyl-ACP methyl ester carboxylesterase